MTGVIRKAAFLAALGLVVAVSVATAGIPSPANSSVPAFVDLVSCSSVGALPPYTKYQATITVRDIGNFPVVNSKVSLHFCTDVRIYSTIPGGTVVCPVYTHTAVTDANGQVTVEIPGAGFNTNGTSVGTNGLNCVSWYADTYLLGTSSVATYDEDGATLLTRQGVAGSDLISWIADKTGLPYVYRPRSDFNHLGSVDGADLILWIQYKTSLPAYISSCGTLCP